MPKGVVLGLVTVVSRYKKLKDMVEKLMRLTLKDVEEEGLKVEVTGLLLKVREKLDGGRNKSNHRR